MDAFQFVGEVGERVLITAVTTSGSLNTEIYLYPPDGGPLEAHTYPGGDEIDHNLQQAGTYTIIVQDYGLNTEGTYNISLLKIPSVVPPMQDVKVNGQDGPIVVPEGQNVTFSYSLDAGSMSGQQGDLVLAMVWWLDDPSLTAPSGFIPLGTWTGLIADLPESELLEEQLPFGCWALCFFVDDSPNGILDSVIASDCAVAIVTPAP